MSSIALKFSSLVIRTISKPIANYIKRQAQEHSKFRKICISSAQYIHRVDMRLRLGLLQDVAAIDRQAAKEAAAAAAKKHKHATTATVKTEAETKAEEEAAAKAAKEPSQPAKASPKPKIRPLSEARAVETGANFISETFLFSVAAALILFESWRSRRKENTRREDVADRLAELEESEKAARRALVELERELLALRAKEGNKGHVKRILPREVYEAEAKSDTPQKPAMGLFSRIAAYISPGTGEDEDAQEAIATDSPGPAEKILAKADAALEEKRRQAAREAAIAAEKKGK